MRRHRHILVPHCKGQQNCRWEICVVCNGYGVVEEGRWTVNPYEFAAEPSTKEPNGHTS